MRRNCTYRSLLNNELPYIYDYDGNVYNIITIGTQQWLGENLKTTKYADGTPIPNISNYNDWFLPSKDEAYLLKTVLYDYGVGSLGITNIFYVTSSEQSALNCYRLLMSTGQDDYSGKNDTFRVRAIRSFTSVTNYNLRDVGPAGGWIFYKNGNNYLEAASSDQSAIAHFSNITNQAIGTTGTAIGTGQANTTAIINQAGHTNSAAKLCDDLTSDMLWAADTEGAYCWYDNDIANKTDYGALYNWYAVDNAHGLAPTGWRVPNRTDFNILSTFLGGDAIAGTKLKEYGMSHWNSSRGTNETGFTCRGAGWRESHPFYSLLKNSAFLWSTEELSVYESYMRLFHSNGLYFNESQAGKKFGLSVRCVRDI